MKNRWGFIAILAMLISVIFLCAYDSTIVASAEDGLSPPWVKNHVYAKVAVVDSIDEEKDLVYMAIPFGDVVFLYAWQGIEDNEVGDIVGMLMYDSNTAYITDDVILSITYSGWNVAEIINK